MSEVRNRANNPVPELAYQEIYIPNDANLGTGSFRFQTKKNTITPPKKPGPKAIAAIALNAPRFQISVSINPGTKEIPVLLGHADGSNPLSSTMFLLPGEFGVDHAHDFRVTFRDWQILSMTMDGEELATK